MTEPRRLSEITPSSLAEIDGVPLGRRPSSALAERNCHDADQSLFRIMRRTCRLLPIFEERTLYPEGEASITMAVAVRIVRDTERTPDDERAAEVVAHALRPAPPEMIVKELYRLRCVTAGRRGESAEDLELTAAVWIEELSCYPADICVTTLREWPRRQSGKWWPTWHELVRILDARFSYRRSIAQALGVPLPRAARFADAA